MKWIRILMMAAGAALLVLGALLFAPGMKSRGWKETAGVVTGHGIIRTYGWKKSQPSVLVRYAYGVDGIRHVGERFSHSRVSPAVQEATPEAALRVFRDDPAMRPWRIGSRVTVYYDPLDPGQAVLRRGDIGLGAAVMVLGGGIVLLGFFSRRSVRQEAATADDRGLPG